jgi:predicted RNA-binding Zn-ribbon protein involved in translation (DUF1610 family)
MMKKILMNSDSETARFDQINNRWISRHGKPFDTEILARMHGCTHFYCQSCGALTHKEKAASMFMCRNCSDESSRSIEVDPNQFAL